MIAADGQRRYTCCMDGREEASDFTERSLQLEWALDPRIPQIGDADKVEGGDAGRLVDLANQRRMVADVARPVTGACPVGGATVKRDADEANVDLGEL